uniref:3-ketoacyl-CoA synthase n=1 Tax=Nelumbo nucifera TaxID=4432 RepID=A0A822YU15_NELNU|nr:TPA_asm: hypothetical protein HUJ06_006782 [Nelumbo nucifera]
MGSIEMDKERLTAEMAFREDSSSVVIKIRRRLPDFLQSVKLKYVKLGYGYTCNYATLLMFILVLPLFVAMSVQLSGLRFDRVSDIWINPTVLQVDSATGWSGVAISLFLLGLYWVKRPRPIYLVDFACYKPEDERKMSVESFLKMTEDNGAFEDESVQFQRRICTRSGLGNKDLLRANPNTYAVVVSTENITLNWYFGNDRSMLLCNCIFRMGGAAVLLSNRGRDRSRSKYQLIHTVRTHKGADDNSYNCVYQREDHKGTIGVSLARELMAVAGDALKTNITTLGPLVLPLSEQLMFFITLVRKKVLKSRVKPYIPDFKLAFEHFCIHAGGRAVLDELQKNLQLSDWHMEPSRMTLHRFGNTSSSSLWYELAYTEAKGRVSSGDRIWQIAFGSGFKCNSAVWKALRAVRVGECQANPWADVVDRYPVKVPAC